MRLEIMKDSIRGLLEPQVSLAVLVNLPTGLAYDNLIKCIAAAPLTRKLGQWAGHSCFHYARKEGWGQRLKLGSNT
jgi:hypothetical protein